MWYNKMTGQRITIHADVDDDTGAGFDGTEKQRAFLNESDPRWTSSRKVGTMTSAHQASKTTQRAAPLRYEPSGISPWFASLDPRALSSWMRKDGTPEDVLG